MKGPDKIYVTPVRTWDTKHIPDLQDNIYICKNALLEWVEKMKSICKGAEPIVKAYQTVIDKLNSM